MEHKFKKKFYETSWFMWVALIFFPPIGIFLLWKHNRFTRRTRVIITVIFSIYFLGQIGGNSELKNSTVDKNTTNSAQKTNITNSEKKDLKEEKANSDEKAEAKAKEEARIAEEKVKAEKAKQAEAERLLNTEAGFKAVCVDIPWAELVKDRTTYKGTYLKKDLMVRQIATIDDETVYLCGENKGEGAYVGGEFVVFDKRSDKSKPIELYDKIYIHGQVSGLWYTGGMNNHIQPHVDAKYIEFKGKFGQ